MFFSEHSVVVKCTLEAAQTATKMQESTACDVHVEKYVSPVLTPYTAIRLAIHCNSNPNSNPDLFF